jgi:hypothetical protein
MAEIDGCLDAPSPIGSPHRHLSGLNKQGPASRSGRRYGSSRDHLTPAPGPHVGPHFCKDAATDVSWRDGRAKLDRAGRQIN